MAGSRTLRSRLRQFALDFVAQIRKVFCEEEPSNLTCLLQNWKLVRYRHFFIWLFHFYLCWCLRKDFPEAIQGTVWWFLMRFHLSELFQAKMELLDRKPLTMINWEPKCSYFTLFHLNSYLLLKICVGFVVIEINLLLNKSTMSKYFKITTLNFNS